MRILALDLGTTTGWAYWSGYSISYGKWDLKPKSHEGSGMRLLKLQQTLETFKDVEMVAYENVSFAQKGSAAVVYGELLGTIKRWAELIGIPYTGVPVGTIKKHATGKGNAGKAQMVKAANDKFDFVVEPLGRNDHDIADALHLLYYAMHEFKGESNGS